MRASCQVPRWLSGRAGDFSSAAVGRRYRRSVASPSGFTVAPTPASDTYPLRAAVLHGGAPPEAAKVAGDDHPGVITFAARDVDGAVVGCAGLFPERCPDLPDHHGQGWRVRRVATAPEWRGRGVGAAVVSAVIAHAEDRGPGLVWCNATPSGQRLFARAGFEQLGEPWVDQEFGPNVRMWRTVSIRPVTEGPTS
ncbi:GNAT family N-acetyltransferase [Nocardioides sp. NPDC000445]|uniref:GNAT family N-acetyltransferase n=1 Tax=Nocardioides sp. NPDC000445 TaxID=3154257 RepID=UPI00331C5FDB